MLTGDAAIIRSTTEYFSTPENGNSKSDCLVHFKVSTDGVTLTDSQRKRFFRKHFPTETVSHCGYDPQGTSIKINGAKCRIFGIVAKKSSSNLCVIFAEKDPNQPATDIIQSVNKVYLNMKN